MTILASADPVAVRQIELSDPLPTLDDLGGYGGVRVFATAGGRLLGHVDLGHRGHVVTPTRLRHAIAEQLGSALLTEFVRRQLVPPTRESRLSADRSASVVVATYDRPDDLRRCLRTVTTQETPRRLEVIVVDNHPSSGLTRPVVADFPGVVLVTEARRGLSYARNAGICASTGEIVVTIDDDVLVPPGWLERLLGPFVQASVMAVTGNVLPLELETRAQRLFEIYGGLGRGYRSWIADAAWFGRFRRGVPTWLLGATANAAFRNTVFADPAIGLAPESLGAGTPTGCSEDTYLFHRILHAGYAIAYHPTAFVWHRHRRTIPELAALIYNYSKGHVAYHLLTVHAGDPRGLVRVLLELPQAYLRRAVHRVRRRTPYPLHLLLHEVAGNLAGPWALWRAQRRAARLGRSGPYHLPQHRGHLKATGGGPGGRAPGAGAEEE